MRRVTAVSLSQCTNCCQTLNTSPRHHREQKIEDPADHLRTTFSVAKMQTPDPNICLKPRSHPAQRRPLAEAPVRVASAIRRRRPPIDNGHRGGAAGGGVEAGGPRCRRLHRGLRHRLPPSACRLVAGRTRSRVCRRSWASRARIPGSPDKHTLSSHARSYCILMLGMWPTCLAVVSRGSS